jgi:hypothetical protein
MKREIYTRLSIVFCGIALMLAGAAARAAEPEWVYPTIKKYGRVAALPDATMQPNKDADYKVVFNMTGGGDADKVNPSLDRVARAVISSRRPVYLYPICTSSW